MPSAPDGPSTTDGPSTSDASSASDPLFAQALGDDWPDLHPAIRDRYGLTSEDERVAVGRGEMDSVTAATLARPALRVLARHDAALPVAGTHVPFEIRTYAFQDGRGREAISLRRRFDLASGPQFFEDALRWDPDRERLVNFLGTDGRVAVELETAVVDGTLRFEFGDQWLWAGARYRRLPEPLCVDGAVVDAYDDASEQFSVEASVRSLLGPIFGFYGAFESDWDDAPDVLPASARAVRYRPMPGR